MTPIPFRRGDIWHVDFVPSRGHEQDGQRPAVIVSVDSLILGLVAPRAYEWIDEKPTLR